MANTRSRRSAYSLICAVLLLGSAGFVLVTRWEVLWAGHLAFPALLVAMVMLGLLLAVRGSQRLVRGDVHPVARAVGGVLSVLGCVVMAAFVLYLRPVAATGNVGSTMASTPSVTVQDTATRIVLQPSGAATSLLIFYPGARIDPRAYVAILKEIAEQGVAVHIVKEPFNMAFFDPWAASSEVSDAAASRVVIGGHSLGGVVASARAASLGTGLVLWASYPASSIAGSGIGVLSIYGSNDQLSTPAEVEASAGALPPHTDLELVDGADHSSFGDFGILAGDGPEDVDHAAAQLQIAQATALFVLGTS